MAESVASGDRLGTSLSSDRVALSFTGSEGALYRVGSNALSAEVLQPTDGRELRCVAAPVLIIHGTQYDPGKTGLSNPHLTFAHVVRANMRSDLTGVSFGWFSAPLNFRNQFKALRLGSATVYGLAHKSLASEIPSLGRLIGLLPPRWTAICHSMGCELLRRALASHPDMSKPMRVLLLSGDLDERAFEQFSDVYGIQVLAVRAKADHTLSFSRFRQQSSPYWSGRAPRRGEWLDLVFYPELIEKGGRWSARYGRRRRFWDHMSTFEFQQPWAIYSEFLRDGLPLRLPDGKLLRVVTAPPR